MEDLRLTEVPVATIQRTGWRGQERTRGSNLNHPVRRGGRCTGAVAVVTQDRGGSGEEQPQRQT